MFCRQLYFTLYAINRALRRLPPPARRQAMGPRGGGTRQHIGAVRAGRRAYFSGADKILVPQCHGTNRIE